jgi:hypothetical protein
VSERLRPNGIYSEADTCEIRIQRFQEALDNRPANLSEAEFLDERIKFLESENDRALRKEEDPFEFRADTWRKWL